MEQTFFDWKYCYNNGEYNIIPNRKIRIPKTFFKYYALNENSIDALTHTYIYASHPNQLNDTTDCSELILEFDDIEYIRPTLKELPCFSNLNDDELLTPENKALAQKAFALSVYRKLGILSLTTSPYNDLLWAYYTQNHGVCIEFDISQFEFKHHGPFPINYQRQLYSIPTSTLKSPYLAVLMQSNIKKSIWEHEREWRLLVEAPGHVDLTTYGASIYAQLGGYDRKFSYPISAIKSITLGMSFFDFDERISFKEEITQNKQGHFQLKDTTTRKLKKDFLDFVSCHSITVNYTYVSNLHEINYIPMTITKSDDREGYYIGKLLEN